MEHACQVIANLSHSVAKHRAVARAAVGEPVELLPHDESSARTREQLMKKGNSLQFFWIEYSDRPILGLDDPVEIPHHSMKRPAELPSYHRQSAALRQRRGLESKAE